jgi:hypothetical protein
MMIRSYLLLGVKTGGKVKKYDLRSDRIALRAHHLFCLLKHNALHTFHPTLPIALKTIKSNPEISIQVVVGADDICLPCPYWRNGRCERRKNMEENNRVIDEKFLAKLGLENGNVIQGKKLSQRMVERVDLACLSEICASCTPEICAAVLTRKSWWE